MTTYLHAGRDVLMAANVLLRLNEIHPDLWRATPRGLMEKIRQATDSISSSITVELARRTRGDDPAFGDDDADEQHSFRLAADTVALRARQFVDLRELDASLDEGN